MIRRINIPVTTGSPSDNVAWWNMPTSRDAAKGYPVEVPPDAEWIALDPGITTPNVSIVVEIPGLGPSLLVPGAVLPIPPRSRPLTMYNPLACLSFDGSYAGPASLGTAVRYGFVGLVCGSAGTYGAWLAYANRVAGAWHKAATILTGWNALNGSFAFPTTNLAAYRVSAFPATAGGARIALVPADFRVTFRRAAAVVGTLPVLLTGAPLDRSSISAAAPAFSNGAATADTWQTVLGEANHMDFTVAVPQWDEVLSVTALAGTGVGTVLVSIEGVARHA